MLPLSAQTTNNITVVTFTCNFECHNCETTMMKNIPYEKGVKDVKVDLEQKQITIWFRNDKNTVENLQKAIVKLGYTAEVASVQPENKPQTK